MKRLLLALLLGFMATDSAPIGAEQLIDRISAQRRFDMCRSEMENRPYDPIRDGPYPKTTNSIGFGAYPPSQQVGLWINLKCWEMPGIYQPFE